jgi:hypothetical protein
MPQDERAATTHSPDTDPSRVAGLEPGGGVAPGDTPPDSDSMSGAVGDDRRNTPNMGPVSGNRTPMVVTLVVLGVLVVMCAVLVGASFIPS